MTAHQLANYLLECPDHRVMFLDKIMGPIPVEQISESEDEKGNIILLDWK